MWLSLAAAVVCGAVMIVCVISAWALKFGAAAGIFAVLFLLGAVAYDRAAVWVDRNGKWE